ncbi:MAG TPA: hypothetical protein ENI19_00320 [Candidatus Nealsonbacteria bacterium]|uniref:Uncharacterized protein n=1 Tax=marine sediment metagenome TaxID=412755 RepID=A0A0F9UJU4_9ZZZZ|nr:hypothetical protein [Candidatus Nealsonbacteria bacterium]HEB46139.1 hypothetical protein [Candidatus Nealsonbacteria bacterium]
MSSSLTNKRFITIGFAASLFLLVVYFSILSAANSFSHAIEQFSQMWYWILPLVAGFGLQVGLYFYIRASFRLRQMANPTAAVTASGGISTGSMVACCLHHLVDVLPLMGLAAAAVFLTQYQAFFLFLGILSNLIGITIMLEIIQKNKLSEGFLRRVLIYNMNQIKKIAIGSSLVLLLAVFFLINDQVKVDVSANISTTETITPKIGSEPKLTEAISLLNKTDNQGEILFKVTPLDFSFNTPVKFEVKIDTHSGSLGFDLTEISILEDDLGNNYQATDWQGSPSGGHHLAGVLVFSKLDIQAKKLKLIIQDSFLRVFEWDLE